MMQLLMVQACALRCETLGKTQHFALLTGAHIFPCLKKPSPDMLLCFSAELEPSNSKHMPLCPGPAHMQGLALLTTIIIMAIVFTIVTDWY